MITQPRLSTTIVLPRAELIQAIKNPKQVRLSVFLHSLCRASLMDDIAARNGDYSCVAGDNAFRPRGVIEEELWLKAREIQRHRFKIRVGNSQKQMRREARRRAAGLPKPGHWTDILVPR